MSQAESIDDPRRQFLIRALAAGLYAAGAGVAGRAAAEGLLGKTPEKLKPGQSFYRLEGEVLVNGKPADASTLISANDSIKTGSQGPAVFVVGQDAFLLRPNSEIKLSGRAKLQQRLQQAKASYGATEPAQPRVPDPGEGVVDAFRLVSGGVLTVFGKTGHQAITSTATVGIRGTGVYFESEPDRSYVCTCYGLTEIAASADRDSFVQVASQHHDAPKYVLAAGERGQRVVKAPFKNHNDLELMLLEELVGRTPPFSVAGDNYGAPRRGY
ncbi:MAG: hypothetical protein HQL47_00425 [Gammaproteobacteria bacterium]|nr:hypothetical protein [Gammaproteobacteria bacterium]